MFCWYLGLALFVARLVGGLLGFVSELKRCLGCAGEWGCWVLIERCSIGFGFVCFSLNLLLAWPPVLLFAAGPGAEG